MHGRRNPSVSLAHTATNPLPFLPIANPSLALILPKTPANHIPNAIRLRTTPHHRIQPPLRTWTKEVRAEGRHVCARVDGAEARIVWGWVCIRGGGIDIGVGTIGGTGTVIMMMIDRIPRRIKAHVPRRADEESAV